MKLTAELRKNELFYNLESERNGQMWDEFADIWLTNGQMWEAIV